MHFLSEKSESKPDAPATEEYGCNICWNNNVRPNFDCFATGIWVGPWDILYLLLLGLKRMIFRKTFRGFRV